MKPTRLLKVLDTCKYQSKYQIPRGDYSKSNTGSKVAAGSVGQQELESAATE